MATFTHIQDRMVCCPYDKNHKIAVRNQIKHIIECEKKVEAKFSVCIYNACHRMPRNEFAAHIHRCSDARQYKRDQHLMQQTNADIEPVVNSNNSSETQITSNSQKQMQDSDEEVCAWDEDNHPSFSIYGTNNDTTHTQVLENKTQKLTKNQKKRNRRKAAMASQKVESIWD